MKAFFKDRILVTGIELITLSFTFFLVRLRHPGESDFGLSVGFLANYVPAILYLTIVLASGRFRKDRNGLPLIFILLVLSLISCYSLNLDFNVFDDSSPWFCILLITVCVNFLVFGWLDHFPGWARCLFFIIAGISFPIFLYLSIYLTPLYAISIPGLLAFGISAHSFIPLLFCIYTIKLLLRTSNRRYRLSFLSAGAACLIFASGYVLNWSRNLVPINKHFQYLSITENNGLPGWVDIAQHINKNATTEKILKTGITYAEFNFDGDFFWSMPGKNFGKRIHDPLVMISQAFCGKVQAPMEDRIKILASIYDSRHEAQDRLWSGEDIRTDQVDAGIRIWPAYRLAYTEMNVLLTHAPKDRFWLSQQEAIYTFHLPEGSVVTSLSLWINGHEEKGVLTSKGKADSAYKTIVGVKRDPSLVHWQEGNTVSVRVFPVPNGQSRKFKIGISSPLKLSGNRLEYENIYFEGPHSAGANEKIALHFEDVPANLSLPAGFKPTGKNAYEKTGSYDPGWSLSLDQAALSTEKFQFGHYAYQVKPIVTTPEDFRPAFIYFDMNASWTPEDANRLFAMVKDRKVYSSDGGVGLIEITEENHAAVFNEQCKKQFSLFPFHKIARPGESLVITSTGPVSPVIDDLENSQFLSDLSGYFNSHTPIHVFDFGQQRSPYLKSLKEFRLLEYAQGSLVDAQQVLEKNRFPHITETPDSVAVRDAGIMLCRTEDSLHGNAPDHLMRLFAYNHIMAATGRNLLSLTEQPEAIVEEAQEAYVVSPVSSLIVLETQHDYDRFGISNSENSLGNASLLSKGSVPEPGEWALILLSLFACSWIYLRPSLRIKLQQK